MDSNPITRSALGNIASIGDLYDARSDKFCGLSIFKKSIPPEAITPTDSHFSDIQLIHSDDFSDKFRKLDIKAELQVSVLSGLVKVEGSGHFLQDQKKSARTVRCSLLYNINTVNEHLNIYHEDLKDAYAIDAIENELATHVVVGVSWGANSVLSCEFRNTDKKDVMKIEGSLKVELNKFSVQVKGQVELEFDDGDISQSNNFSFRIYGDVLPSQDDLPTDVGGALHLMKQMPSLVASCNEGKGKPLVYTMIPIALLQTYLDFQLKSDVMLRSLEEACLLRIVKLFEEISNAQQRVYDFHKDALKHRYCVEEDDIAQISSIKDELRIQESKLRSKLATVLVQVRSGEAEVSELEDLIEEFQSEDFSPEKVALILDTWGDLSKKISFASTIVNMGATYIGYGVDLDEEFIKDLDSKTFVFYFTKDSSADSEVWSQNRQIFFQELKKNSEGCRAFVVDCDIYPHLLPDGKSSCIQVVQNAQVLSEDLRTDQEEQESIPFAQAVTGTKRVISKPNKRAPLRIPCPGQSCYQGEVYDWICKRCNSPLEWGFDEQVYCKCGRTPATLLEFKCPDRNHGLTFATHEDPEYYGDLLSRLTAFDEINILILGETGVGKSTWINAFVNFMKHSSLDEAEASEIVNLIPSEFTVFNEDFDEILVRTGEDQNEVLEAGQSATQDAKIYSFQIGDTTIRLIDTPGVGDVRGVKRDKINFQNILNTLDTLEELHGICILLKPNNARVNVMFRFCIKELLTHLHRDASKNIVFCFTNSRGTFYRPGDTMPALKKLLSENKDVNITISQHTVYCYDSEAYRFLAAVKNDPPVTFSDDERTNFSQSWDKSIKETVRMLEHIRCLTPHPIKSTINLNHARAMILKLTRPLAEIARNIQTNKAIVADNCKAIEGGNLTIEDLKSQLYTTQIDIERKPLARPKTVCSNTGCTQMRTLEGGVKTLIYIRDCHNPCFLSGVTADTIGDPGLLGCAAINSTTGSCHGCGHYYQAHLHVYYESMEVSKQVVDQSIKDALERTTNDQEATMLAIQNKKELIGEYEAELKEIHDASIKFAYFLKTNAITPYNDGMEKYLDHLIREEEEKVDAGGMRGALDGLIKSKDAYIQERQVLEDAMKRETDEVIDAFDPQDIERIVDQLKNLKHSGQSLKDALDCVNGTVTAAAVSSIVHVPVQPTASETKKSGGVVKSIIGGVKSFFGRK